MITVTQEFKDALRAPVKDVSGYLVLEDGTQILPDGDLQRYTIDTVGGLLRTAMSKITISLLGEHNLVDESIEVFYGVYYNGQYNYVQRGKFNIYEAKYKKDTDTTELIGYDNMMLFATEYTTVGTYPTTLYEYLQFVASLVGVTVESTEIYNGTLTMEQDYYANVEEITIRDVLEDICEASSSYALINYKGNLELRQIEDTGEVLTYDDLMKYELGDYWGEINSVVLSRQPQNDDVYLSDELSINAPTTKNLLDLRKFRTTYSAEDD